MMLWELNKYERSKDDQPGDFFIELDDQWSDIAFIVNFTVNGHKYVCKIYAQTEEEAVGIFCMCHPHLSYSDLDSVERLED